MIYLRGQILFRGSDITRMPSHRISRMQMGLVPQGRPIFASLTVSENLAIAARDGSARSRNFDKIFAAFPRLKERARNMGNELSGGEQQMVAIARALISNLLLLLMDEPTERLAPALVQDLVNLILRLKSGGLSILLIEQNIAFAAKLADYVHVMSKGRIVHSSDPQALWRALEMMERLLGIPRRATG
jgi:branched-chain amino acid transport system ATP-binding protein